MPITLSLQPQEEARLIALAQARGVLLAVGVPNEE